MLLRRARVLDVVAGVYRDDHDVLVRAGRITAVGRGLVAQDVPAVDLSGRTLLPGFIDCHVHLLAVTDATYRDIVNTGREPVLVAFMDETDSGCRALRPILTELARDRAGRLVVATIDVAANPATVEAWGVTRVPVMLLFHRGVMQRVLRGVRPYARLVKEIDEMAFTQIRYTVL